MLRPLIHKISLFAVLFFSLLTIHAAIAAPSLQNESSLTQSFIELEQSISYDLQHAKVLIDSLNGRLKGSNNHAQWAKLHNLTGYVDILSGDYDSAYANLTLGKKKAFRSNNRYEQAESLRLEAVLYSLTNLPQESLPLFTQALAIHKELDSDKELNTLQGISLYYRNLEDYDKYLEYGELLLKHPLTKTKLKFQGVAQLTVGEAYVKLGQYKKAKRHLLEAARIMEQASSVWASEAYISLAEVELMTNGPTIALRMLDVSKNIARQKKYSTANVLTGLLEAKIYIMAKKTGDAIDLLEELLIQISADKDQSGQKKIHDMLSDLYEQTGDFKRSLEHQKKYRTTNELVQSETRRTQATLYRTRLDFEMKEQQISQLKAAQAVKQLESEQQKRNSRTRDIILGLSIFILAAVTFYSLRSRVVHRKIARLAKEAKNANYAKRNFLAKMSHELRTPMNAIIGLSQLTLKDNLSQTQRDNIGMVYASSQSLLTLLNDILDFSKIESQKLTLEHNQFLLGDSITRLTDVCSFSIQEKQLNLNIKVDSDVPNVLVGDALRLEQILINLVNNAVKFTQKGDLSVHISLVGKHNTKCTLSFSVTDNGIGISEEQLERLFHPFAQADDSITRQYGGSGLGLTICKELVSLMGGEISVDSELGKGSCFTFTANLVANSQGNAAIGNVDLSRLAELKVLIVDDSKSSRTLIENSLIDLSIESSQAQDGISALEMIMRAIESGDPFDVVLMDWRMPGLDGFESIRIISQAINAHLPKFIIVSSFGMSDAINQSKHLPVTDILEKPIQFDKLVASLSKTVLIQVSGTNKSATPTFPKNLGIVPLKLLLAEDNLVNQRVILGFLADENIDVDIVGNGQLAIDKILAISYDIVLMDVQMPVMDGITATKIIRDELKINTPIVAMTAFSSESDIAKSSTAGMNVHITKPIDAKLLLTVIHDLVNEDVSTDMSS